MDNLRTIILAAGKGTRMKSDLPKVLHKVSGKALIDYVVEVARSAGSLKNYIVLGHQIEVVRKHLSKDFIILEQDKLLGTADAVRRAQGHLKDFSGDVLVLCGDTPLLNATTIQQIVKRQRAIKSVCTFLTANVSSPQGYGRIIRNSKGVATAIREDKDCTDAERKISEINVGVYCFNAKALFKALGQIQLNAKKKEFYLTDVIEDFSKQDLRVETIETLEPIEGLGVNTREDLAIAEAVVRGKILKDFMLNGVTIVDPNTTFIDAGAKIGQDTVIRPFTVIEENVVIGSGCVIGPFAHIRPGSVLGNDVEVGNFTEVSRTKIGAKSRMKHFSFLGDALVGQSVNIGAGTVTANYDGKNKNQTTIGDQAFIGSDSILVAPVKIGKKAVTGAGSVVTKGSFVPEGGLAVGVPAVITSRRRK